jgi:hypothetical protein
MRIADHVKQHDGADSERWLQDMLAFMNLRFAGK